MGEDTVLLQQNDSDIIVQTLRIYGSVFLVSFAGFTLARHRYPRLFSIRSWSPKLKCQLAQNDYGCLLWFIRVFRVSDEDIFNQCGMDALCFIRSMRLGRKLGLLGSLNAIWLIPLYATAKDSMETVYLSDGLVIITLAHLPNQSPRYLGTLIAMYLNFLFAMYLILQEMKWYTIWRHRFLSKREPRNYAVYVSGIPPEWRTTRGLRTYFQNCTSPDDVVEAHIALDVPNLESRQARRDEVVRKLEHTWVKDRIRGDPTMHHRVRLNKGTIDKVETQSELQAELDLLNRSIPADIQKALMKSDDTVSQPSRATGSRNVLAGLEPLEESLLDNGSHKLNREQRNESSNPSDNSARSASYHSCSSEVNTQREDPDVFQDPSHSSIESMSLHSSQQESNGESSTAARSSTRSMARSMRRSTQSLSTSAKMASHSISTTMTTGSQAAKSSLMKGSAVATGAIKKVREVKVDKVIKSAAEGGAKGVIKVGNEIATSASAVVPMLRVKGGGTPRSAGFVVFRRLYSVQSLLQMIHDARPYVMECSEAPDPGDIYWRNVGLPARARRVGKLLSISATVVTCIFWSVPMAFISSLTEVSSLKETMPKLARFLEKNPSFEPLLVQLAPLLLLIMNELILPEILKYFAAWEGFISAAMLEASLFLKLGVFMIIQTFFVSAISGGISAELANMLSNPERIFDFLANSLPAQSTYFAQVILTSTFVLQSFELLRVYPLATALLRQWFGPRLTKKERQEPWFFLHPLEDPPDFGHAEIFAQIILFFMIFFVYAVIAPFTSFVVLVCFLILESGYRYQFIHNFPRAFDTGGKLWHHFLQFLLSCMIVAQLTLMGLMALKQSRFAGPVLIPLLVINCLFILFVNSNHSAVTRHLPTAQCIAEDGRPLLGDEEEADAPMDHGFAREEYLQPALRRRIVEPTYEE